jgi:hypothetical protein
MLGRLLGVLSADANIFEQIEHDPNANFQATAVVTIVTVVSAVLGAATAYNDGGSFVNQLVYQLLMGYLSWLFWAGITYLIGTTVFQGQATLGQMLRTLGFAQAPSVLVIIPEVGGILALSWTIAISFIAIRQALDLSNSRTFLTIVIIVSFLLALAFLLAQLFDVRFTLLQVFLSQ